MKKESSHLQTKSKIKNNNIIDFIIVRLDFVLFKYIEVISNNRQVTKLMMKHFIYT